MRSIIVILGITQLADAANLRIYDYSLEKYDEANWDQPDKLINSPYYNSSCFNLCYTFGFGGKSYGLATNTSLTAMIGFKQIVCANVFLLNWEKEASVTDVFGEVGIKIAYATKVLPSSMVVSEKFCQFLLNLEEKFDFNLDRLHLIGHSLGAHVLGNTGRCVKERGKGALIDLITGVDPAGPLFDSSSLLPRMDKTCGRTVVAIHTDPGGYGTNESKATVDIWVNFYNFIQGTADQQVQPGCQNGSFTFMSKEDICSHDRSWMLLAETWLNNSLLASKARNYTEFAAGNATTVISIGHFINRNASGDFFMNTNAESPYGKGKDGLHQ